jgi:hypothetical protein
VRNLPRSFPSLAALQAKLSPLLLLSALVLLFFADLVLHPGQVLNADHSDLLAMHLPMKRFLVHSLHETGELPLWNPYVFGGTPFVHDVQAGMFYPLHWPLLLLPEESVGCALSWLVALHVLIAGWCMFAYARHQNLSREASLVAAIGYMFAGKWLLHILAGGHCIVTPLAWVPLVLLWLEQAIVRRSLVRATWAGAAFALIVVGGHPQMTLYAGLLIGLYSLGVLFQEEGVARGAYARWAFHGVWTLVCALVLSAVQLLPALEAAPESSRAAGISVQDTLASVGPSLLGLFGPGWSESWEERAGLGVLWAAAACLAPLFCPRRARFPVIVSLLLLAFSLGGAALLQALPGFRLFQLPARMLMLLAFPLSLLAALTTETLVRNQCLPAEQQAPALRILVRVLFVGFAFAAGTAVLNYLSWRQTGGVIEASSLADWMRQLNPRALLYWGTLLLLAPLLVWLVSKRWPLFAGKQVAWILLLLLDALALTATQVAVRPQAEVYPLTQTVYQLIQSKQQNAADRWRVLDRGLPGMPSSSPVGPSLPMLGTVQVESVLGYNTFDVRRYKEYLQMVADEDTPLRPRASVFGYPIVAEFPIKNKSLLDLLGTRYLVEREEAHKEPRAAGEPGIHSGWQEVAGLDEHSRSYSFLAGGVQELPPFRVFENRERFPRAFVVAHAVPLQGGAERLQQMKNTDFRQQVLLEDMGESNAAEATYAQGIAQIRTYLPNIVELDAQADVQGYLVLTDVWFPGWTCLVDGKSAAVLRADFLFRAVALPAGTHRVVFSFEPKSYRWGKRISLCGLGLVAAFSLWAIPCPWRRRYGCSISPVA